MVSDNLWFISFILLDTSMLLVGDSPPSPPPRDREPSRIGNDISLHAPPSIKDRNWSKVESTPATLFKSFNARVASCDTLRYTMSWMCKLLALRKKTMEANTKTTVHPPVRLVWSVDSKNWIERHCEIQVYRTVSNKQDPTWAF